MTAWDHGFVAVAVVLSPLYSLWGYRQLERRVAEGVHGARMREYVETIALLWLFGLGAVAVWAWQGRPLEAIGLTLPRGWAVAPAAAVTGAIVWFLWAQLARVRRTSRRPVTGVEQIERVRALLPQDAGEMRAFAVAAVSAGVFEEVVYRGYLISYLESFMPLWVAVLASSLAFAWGHIYQGLGNLPQIFVLALGSAALYLWTGSLLLPMILHASIDVLSALTAREVLAKPRA